MKNFIAPPDLSNLIFDVSQHEGITHPAGDFWLFAYGSLMWNPEFDYLRSETARLYGYHRCLCLWSVEYRGTLEKPGLVMGLDQGGSCLGRAYLIGEKSATNIMHKLNEREMITGAYYSKVKSLRLSTGEQVNAVCLIARRDHPQYATGLDQQTKIKLVQQAHGKRGSNLEYVVNTVSHLKEMGIADRSLAGMGEQGTG